MLYEVPEIEYLTARSVKEAVSWLVQHGSEAKIIAGGTDLLGLMKDRIVGPQMPMPRVLIGIKRISGLDRIQYDDGNGLTIGAAATLASIETSKTVLQKFPILAQAAGSIAIRQIRNMGTIGGNLCQRPWCWYFRVPYFNCYKKGGSMCYAITGENKTYFSILGLGVCVMAHPSDMAPALISLGASVRIDGPSGRRMVPMEDFFNGPRDVFETVLRNDEILSEIYVPEQLEGTVGVYLKERPRGAWDFALASVAALLRIQESICVDAKIVLGGVAPFPYRAWEAENAIKGKAIGRDLAVRAGEIAVFWAHPLKMNRYKIPLTKALVKKALLRCFESTSRSVTTSP
jgi:xanthine dehydrogenase YagS FAD-binding subunit